MSNQVKMLCKKPSRLIKLFYICYLKNKHHVVGRVHLPRTNEQDLDAYLRTALNNLKRLDAKSAV